MNEDDDKATIYVGNLPEEITPQDLFAYFNTFGQIKTVEIPKDHLMHKYRGFAFVQFDEREDATAAIDNYDKSEFMNRTIRVRRARPIDKKPDYHKAIWANDDWMQKMEQFKIETQNLTKAEQQKNRQLKLPILKQVQPKQEQKPLLYIQND